MARTNAHYDKLAAGYLFPEIARRTREFQEANPGTRVLSLGIGDTTEALTTTVLAGLYRGVDKLGDAATYTGYGDGQGDVELREMLSERYADRGVTVDASEVFVSDGAKPDSANIQSIFAQDSVVAVQDPAYPVYVDSNVMAGRTGAGEAGQYGGLVYMACTEANGFFPDVPDAKVDLIYICNPNNPTGAVATGAQLGEFVEYALAHRAVLIFDAAYCAYISDPGLPRSIYEIEGARSCAIEINSFSKDAGFTGVRLGWTVVPVDLVVEGTEKGKVHALWSRRQSTMFNGPSNLAQQGAMAALSAEGQRECQQLVDYYMQNARAIRSALEGIGLSVFGGVHAPYIWLKTPSGMASWDFFDKLLTETHVVGTPGAGFGPSGEGYFRLSAFGHHEDIAHAVESIQQNLDL